jgi:hypothetical protein
MRTQSAVGLKTLTDVDPARLGIGDGSYGTLLIHGDDDRNTDHSATMPSAKRPSDKLKPHAPPGIAGPSGSVLLPNSVLHRLPICRRRRRHRHDRVVQGSTKPILPIAHLHGGDHAVRREVRDLRKGEALGAGSGRIRTVSLHRRSNQIESAGSGGDLGGQVH